MVWSQIIVALYGQLVTLQKGDIDALEKVQKRATKVLPELKNKSYIKRLKMCNLNKHCTSDEYVVIWLKYLRY